MILHNFQVNGVGESDTVHIFADSSRVWVDHLTSFDAKLGLVSVLQGSTDVTISNSDLMNSNFNMLLGASDADKQDQNMRVTIFRNWFKDSMQRMPHCRYDVHTYIHTRSSSIHTYIHTHIQEAAQSDYSYSYYLLLYKISQLQNLLIPLPLI